MQPQQSFYHESIVFGVSNFAIWWSLTILCRSIASFETRAKLTCNSMGSLKIVALCNFVIYMFCNKMTVKTLQYFRMFLARLRLGYINNNVDFSWQDKAHTALGYLSICLLYLDRHMLRFWMLTPKTDGLSRQLRHEDETIFADLVRGMPRFQILWKRFPWRPLIKHTDNYSLLSVCFLFSGFLLFRGFSDKEGQTSSK